MARLPWLVAASFQSTRNSPIGSANHNSKNGRKHELFGMRTAPIISREDHVRLRYQLEIFRLRLGTHLLDPANECLGRFSQRFLFAVDDARCHEQEQNQWQAETRRCFDDVRHEQASRGGNTHASNQPHGRASQPHGRISLVYRDAKLRRYQFGRGPPERSLPDAAQRRRSKILLQGRSLSIARNA